MKIIPFNLEKAKAGAKVVKHDGTPVRIVCWDGEFTIAGILYPIIDSVTNSYTENGISGFQRNLHRDLFLLSELKLRPWKPEEVPVGFVLRLKNSNTIYYPLSQGYENKVEISLSLKDEDLHIDFLNLSELLSRYEHSTDHGKTWLPCGVEE